MHTGSGTFCPSPQRIIGSILSGQSVWRGAVHLRCEYIQVGCLDMCARSGLDLWCAIVGGVPLIVGAPGGISVRQEELAAAQHRCMPREKRLTFIRGVLHLIGVHVTVELIFLFPQ